MKNKLFPKTLLLCLIPAILAVACSEGAYVPTAGNPSYNTGTVLNNGIYPNGIRPNTGIYPNNGFYPNTGMYPNNNGYMNYGYTNTFVPRPVFGWNFHISAGLFTPNYLNYMNTGNCIPGNTYTSTCSQNTVRTPCPYRSYDTDRDSDRTTTTTSSTSDSTRHSPCPYNVDKHPSTTSTDPASMSDDEIKTKIQPFYINADSGRALYERLAVELDSSKKITARTGEIYKCTKDATDDKDIKYVCGFELRMKDGSFLKQANPGQPDQPEIFSGTPVKTSNVTVNSTEDASVHVAGKLGSPTGIFAEFLFKHLPGTAKEGKVDEVSVPSASVKVSGQIKCYEMVNDKKETVAGCVIKIKTDTGAALTSN